ncbi:MAG: hypothetical protein IPH96_08795 [Saprospiraceae bacterium]|nr:hypothetical protein [Saprospiraceae bacterium]
MASHIDNLVTSLYEFWIKSHKPIKIYGIDFIQDQFKKDSWLENGFKYEIESFNTTPNNQKRVLSLFWIRIQKDSFINRHNTIGGIDKAINWRLEGVKKIADVKVGDEIVCSMSYSDYNEKVKIIRDIINRYLKSLDIAPSTEPENESEPEMAEIDPMFKAISTKMLLLKKLGIIDLLENYIINETGIQNKKSLVNLIAQVINDGRIATIKRSITALSLKLQMIKTIQKTINQRTFLIQ